MRAIEVLEKHLDLIEFWDSETGVVFADGWLKMAQDDDAMMDFDEGWDAEILAKTESLKLDASETYWVSTDMMKVMESASLTIPDSIINEWDLPSKSGFVWFEEPLFTQDSRGQMINTRVFTWAPARMWENDEEIRGVWITAYSDRDVVDEATLNNPEHSRLFQIHISSFPQLLIWHASSFPFGKTWVSQVTERPGIFSMLRTFWSFVQQEIPVDSRVGMDRGTRRRIQRRNLTPPQEQVRVIALRKKRYQNRPVDNEEPDFEYSHRFMVAGHWRNQWYPKENRHKPVYINTYVKGPEDKPLVMKDRVYKWMR